MKKDDTLIPNSELSEKIKEIESYIITRVKLSPKKIYYSIEIKKRDSYKSPEDIKKIN